MENSFPSNLKQLRKERNVTQTQLAEALHCTAKTISHWETGYTEPSIAQILLLAKYFEIELEELLCK